jgi:hypothetical protein
VQLSKCAVIEIATWRERHHVRGLVRIRTGKFIPTTAGAAANPD